MLILIAEKFNLSNRAKLWELRAYHGFNSLHHSHCDQLGRITTITSETEVDRRIAAGQNIYVDVPCDPNGPDGSWKEQK